MPAAERAVAARIQAALERAQTDASGTAAERVSVVAFCRHAGISRNTLYRYYPEVLQAIRRLQRRSDVNTTQVATIRRLRAELADTGALSRHLSALVDHYATAYRETCDLLAQRDRELAEERRSRGSLPTALRR